MASPTPSSVPSSGHPPSARAPINWVATIMFVVTGLVAAVGVPLYAWFFDFSLAAWVWFLVFLWASGISITAGYHRLWSHGAYEAHWSVRLFFMLFGAMAVQNSILIWCAGHRPHHRFVDDAERDPYSATRGLWFSHMGWMVRNHPSGEPDFGYVRDLERDPIVAFQHRFYVPIVLAMNVGLVALVGWASGDLWGTLLLAGFLRLVLNHHFTFFINSLAHYWGTQPYTDENTARDNPVLAFLTYGEGYHNFHHIFTHDYRNGIKWYDFDPTKWLIRGLASVGLARKLRVTPQIAIERARLDMQFKRARARLESGAVTRGRIELAQVRERIQKEYEAFTATLAEWSATREQWASAAKERVARRLEGVDLQAYAREIEARLRAQRKRVQALTLQLA
ncbi:MAG: fatty acid desaturase [Pseudomonadota bacterium]|jgi:stearoyl-CoA desaturase (delta-9 desaturase)